jgi:GLPGLI family protein
MKQIYSVIVLLGIASIVSGQQITYDKIITYETYISWDNPPNNISHLYVGQDKSCFVLTNPHEEIRKIDLVAGKGSINGAVKYPRFYMTNFGNHHLLFMGQIFQKYCLVNDSVSIKWKLINKKKDINGYVCHEATGKFRGREYTVWYSDEVPLSLGPWKLGGLPGLIFEAKDTTGNVSFKLVKIENKPGTLDMEKPALGKVTWKKYEECVSKAWKHMVAYLKTLGNDNTHVSVSKVHLLEPVILNK